MFFFENNNLSFFICISVIYEENEQIFLFLLTICFHLIKFPIFTNLYMNLQYLNRKKNYLHLISKY